MKIKTVTIQNFLGLKEAVIELDDKGLVLIQGDNKDDTSADSNGAGKSSLIDAVCWACYGATARDLSGDDVINHVAGKDCIVEAQIVDGEDEYTITRWRKAKGFHKRSGVALEVNGVDKSGGTDTLTQAAINEVMGCTADVFNAAVYAGQEKMPDIPSMTDRNLKSLIEEASGIEIVEAAYGIARERVREAVSTKELKDTQVAKAKDLADQCKTVLERMEASAKEWKAGRKEIVDAATDIIQRAAKEIIRIEALVEHEREKGFDTRLEEIETRIAEYMAEIRLVDDAIAGVGKEEKEASRLSKAVNHLEGSVSLAKRQAIASTEAFKKAKRNYENAESELGEPCRTCGKPKTEEDLGEIKERLKEAARQAKDEAQHDRTVLESEKAKLETAKAEYEEYQANRTDISAEIDRKRVLNEKVTTLTEGKNKLTAKLRAIEELESDLVNAERKHTEAIDRKKTLEEAENPHAANVAKSQEEYNAALDKIEPAEDAFAEAARQVLIAEHVAKTFGPKGVRAHILDTVTPFLNDRTAYYLSTLSDGTIEAVWTTLTESSTGELKEKFSIMVQKNGAGKFASLSGGEKRKVRLATMLALQDLVASRASKPISLWVGDEIDNALDPAGLERLMSLLEMKAREKGTVLIVSHLDLGDWVRDTVTVTMEGKQATVEGVLCPKV